MFQQHPQRDVNETVLLHEGRFRVRAGNRSIEASGSAHLRWLPSPGIEFDIETDETVEPDLEALTVELPRFATKNVVVYSAPAPGLIRAFAAEMDGAVVDAFSRLGSRSSTSPTSSRRDRPQSPETQRQWPGTLVRFRRST